MAAHLDAVLGNPRLAKRLVQHGLRTINARHTCAHRVDQLLAIAARLGVPVEEEIAVERHA